MDAVTLEPISRLELDLTAWKAVVQPTHPIGKWRRFTRVRPRGVRNPCRYIAGAPVVGFSERP